MEDHEDKIQRCFAAISRFGPHPETTARDLERARQAVIQQAASRPADGPTLPGRLVRSRTLRVAAVLCVGAMVLLALLDGGLQLDGSKAALAQVIQAMNQMPVMHQVYRTSYGDPKVHETETWYDFGSRTVLAKYSTDGTCVKISSLNYDTMEDVVYEPQAGVVKIVYRCDVAPNAYPDSPADVVQSRVDLYGSRGAQIDCQRTKQDGLDMDVYRFRIAANEHRREELATLVVNRQTNLPMAATWQNWKEDGAVTFDQTLTFDFPAVGPQDIYAIGAPQTAQVVLDTVSQERYEKKRRLEERIPQLKEQFERSLDTVYRIPEGQALALVPPSLVGPRLELERVEQEIGRLVDEQVRERLGKPRRGGSGNGTGGKGSAPAGVNQAPPQFQCFLWDNGIDLRKDRPVFTGAATLKDALDRIVGLSVFEYELPAGLADVNLPGDWVVRKPSSKEQRLAAFERIVRDGTGRSIVFQPSCVEREVIVAGGSFLFQPLSGTYNDSWIHVYADRLDPDTRGGGGSGSLAKFIRYLGEINFNQQVIDETEGDRDAQVHYGWHESGYIRQITDTEDRAQKLHLVLDNVSRQTGLMFRLERRTVCVWHVREERAAQRSP
jgi:hypothetical protein